MRALRWRTSLGAVAFDEVDGLYPSFDDYLHDGLDLSDATITALRARFLY